MLKNVVEQGKEATNKYIIGGSTCNDIMMKLKGNALSYTIKWERAIYSFFANETIKL